MIVEETVDGILSDEKMIQEIKAKLYPKVEHNVFQQL